MQNEFVRIGEIRVSLSPKRNIERPANPKLPIAIVTIEHSPRVKPISEVALRRGVTEPSFDRIIDFPHVTRINQARGVGGIKSDIRSGNALQVTITDIQLPPFDLLEQTDHGDVLVVPRGKIPTI
jgi:hypothetical protein